MRNFLGLPVVCLMLLGDGLACGRGSIAISNNGYRQMLVAIGENVTEDAQLITRIKEALTQASRFLYQVTRRRAFFHDVTILVPPTWDDMPDYQPIGRESFDKSDIIIDHPDPRFMDQADRPFTLRTTPCGQLGHYIHLTPNYLSDSTVADKFGPYDKTLVHEWSHLRYGVFDEYPSEATGQHFYASWNGEIEGTRCAVSLPGRFFDTTNNGRCNYKGSLPDENCRFQDDENLVGSYGSIMYKHKLNHIQEFCDNDDSNPKTLHNRQAPTLQNEQCDYRSVWEVLREHPDFEGINLPRNVSDVTPSFRVVRQKEKRTVLVLDKSGSMGPSSPGNKIAKLGQGCSNYITNIVRDGEQLGIVWFSGDAEAAKNMTLIDSSTRQEMLAHIPTEAQGSTSIGAGIQESLRMLERDGGAAGAILIVVSDGEERQPPYIDDVEDLVMQSGVTIHSIAITNDADSRLDELAQKTGGLSFLYSASDTSNALNEAFQSIGELNLDPSQRKYTILSEAEVIDVGGTLIESIAIDPSLGRDTEFIVDYSSSDVDVLLVAPTSQRYDKNSPQFSKDSTFGIYRFVFPGKIPATGTWTFKVDNPSSITDAQRVALTVTSKPAQDGEYPIIARCFWGKRNMDVTGSNPDMQSLYASVSQGYASVLNAVVKATVERPDGTSVELTLQDNGAGADPIKDDGIYAAYFVDVNAKGRYNVKIQVNSTSTTVISARRIIGQGAFRFFNSLEDAADSPTGDFQRMASGGSFELGEFNVASGKIYPPGKITDLRVLSADHVKREVALQWNAVGAQLDVGSANKYDLRMSTDFGDMLTNFTAQLSVTRDMVLSGGDLDAPLPAGTIENITIQLMSSGEVTYVFALVARDLDGRDVAGPISNIVTASMKAPPGGGMSAAATVGVVFGCLLFVSLVAGVALVVLNHMSNKKKKEKEEELRPSKSKREHIYENPEPELNASVTHIA